MTNEIISKEHNVCDFRFAFRTDNSVLISLANRLTGHLVWHTNNRWIELIVNPTERWDTNTGSL